MVKIDILNKVKSPACPAGRQKSKVKIMVLFLGIFSLSLSWILFFGSSNCLFAQDKIIAVVNNDVITQKDLNDFTNFMKMRTPEKNKAIWSKEKAETMKSDLLQRLIEDRLILQEAKKSKMSFDESRVKARIAEIKNSYSSEAEFQQALRKQGLVQADIEAKIKEQILMHNIVENKIHKNIVIRPDEVTSLYDKNKPDFVSPEERQLTVLTLESFDLAKNVASGLKNGEKPEDLATKYSARADQVKVSRKDELKKEIGVVVFKLNAMDVSEPVSIEGKYYVFRLDSILSARQMPLSEVQDKIYNYIFERKMQEELIKWLDELKNKSYIKIIQS